MTYSEFRNNPPRRKNGKFMSYNDYKDKLRTDKIVQAMFAIILIGSIFVVACQPTNAIEDINPTEAGYSNTIITPNPQADESNEIHYYTVEEIERRESNQVKIDNLQSYLTSVNSPMDAQYIYDTANKYDVNPEILTAIACTESSCWKYCYYGNCYGWAITDSGNFSDYWSDIYVGLDEFAKEYSQSRYAELETAESISSAGYNTRQSWINSMNYFLSEIR